EVLDQADRASIALHVEYRASAQFAVLHGIDRAALEACLHEPIGGPATAAPALAPIAGASRPAECQRYDLAIHDLARCHGEIPETLASSLPAAAAVLRDAAPGDAAAACRRALDVVGRVNARRAELGWPCDDPGEQIHGSALQGMQLVRQVDDRTLLIAEHELVHFVDDHTVVTVSEEDRPGKGLDQARADLAAMLGPATPRWYDASRAARGSHPIWVVLDLPHFDPIDDPRRHKLPRVVGTADVDRDVAADLQILDAGRKDVATAGEILERAVADPMFHGATFAASCAGPPPAGPRAERCARVLAGRRTANTTPDAAARHAAFAAIDGAAAQRACVERWPDSELACLEAARDQAAAIKCYEQAPAASVEDYETALPCGTQPIRLRAGLPLLLVESLKIAEITDRHTRADCHAAVVGVPAQLAVGPAETELGDKLAFAAFDGEQAIDLDPGFAGHNDARWQRGARMVAATRCDGPLVLALPPGAQGSFELRTACGGRPLSAWIDGKGARLCRANPVNDCVTVPPGSAPSEATIDADQHQVALVTGVPGAQAIEIWDFAGHKRIARFAAGTSAQQPCAHVALFGDRVQVDAGACERPGPERGGEGAGGDPSRFAEANAYLATLQGKRIARIGGDQPIATVRAPVALGDHRWAFIASRGEAVVIQDVATGAVVKRIATGEQVEPGIVAAGADAAGHLVLMFGGTNPRADGLSVIDVAAGTVRPIAARPVCPAGQDEAGAP
ncbi:MAG TPA: hypothetical protein VH165_15010, partial [Kofleriaceae bacterium]|nr:hypothetical protein [Kofleriaceae bacterium]